MYFFRIERNFYFSSGSFQKTLRIACFPFYCSPVFTFFCRRRSRRSRAGPIGRKSQRERNRTLNKGLSPEEMAILMNQA